MFIQYLEWVIGLTGHLGDFILEFKRSGVSLQRLQALVPDSPGRSLVSSSSDFPAAVKGEQQKTPAALRVRGLTYRYGLSDNGIQHADLEVEPGQLTVITGSMGVGKTTLLRSILGLLPAQSGQIQWNGKDVSAPALFFVPPRCAYVAQAPRLFSGSLADNITLGLEATQEQVLNAVRNAVLERDVHSMSEGIETRVGPRGLRLSGGQVQRTAMARALVRTSDLLVLDDLSSALDVEVEQELLDRLLSGGQTILAVSHRPRVLERAASVVLVHDGRVVAQGSLATLLASNDEMKRLWRSNEDA